MATIEEFQRDLTNPALVQSFVTQAKTAQVTAGNGTVLIATDPPSVLAKQADATEDEMSLARALKSEGYGGPVSQKARAIAAIGQAIMNKAASVGKSVTELLTHSDFPNATGHYGEQSGRYAATSQDPRPWHLKLAKALLRHELPDIANGGMYFLDPWEPGAEQRGKKLEPFEDVLRRWHEKYHYVRVPMPGITEDALMMFKPSTDSVAIAESLASSIVAWKNAFVARGQAAARESEGRIGGSTDDVNKTIQKVTFAGKDFIDQEAAMRNYAAAHYGRNAIDVNMSGYFLAQMTIYWTIMANLMIKENVGAQIPEETAITAQWKRDFQAFQNMIPVFRKEAERVGVNNNSAMAEPVITSTFWRLLIKVVLPLNGIKTTPSVMTLVIESIKEAALDLVPNPKAIGGGLKTLAKIAAGGIALILAAKIIKD